MDPNQTVRLPRQEVEAALEEVQRPHTPGDVNDALLAKPVWSDQDVAAAGIPIVDAPMVTVGGGIGSMIMVDYLRIAGVPASDIKTLSPAKVPWEQYEYLTQVSQVPRPERLRSDSSGCPDNIWGFPAYSFREARHARTASERLAPLWQVFSEPIFTDYYTPAPARSSKHSRKRPIGSAIGTPWRRVLSGSCAVARTADISRS